MEYELNLNSNEFHLHTFIITDYNNFNENMDRCLDLKEELEDAGVEFRICPVFYTNDDGSLMLMYNVPEEINKKFHVYSSLVSDLSINNEQFRVDFGKYCQHGIEFSIDKNDFDLSNNILEVILNTEYVYED